MKSNLYLAAMYIYPPTPSPRAVWGSLGAVNAKAPYLMPTDFTVSEVAIYTMEARGPSLEQDQSYTCSLS